MAVKFIHNSALSETIILDDGTVYAPTDDDKATKTLPKAVKDVLEKKEALRKQEEDARKAERERIAKEAEALLNGEIDAEAEKPAG